MKAQPFRIERLADHDRTAFDCGVPALDQYLRTQAGADRRRRVSFCYLAIDNQTDRVAGYYTLSATGVPLTALPRATTKRLPRYPTVPAVLVGRLVVDRRDQGRKLGGVLLVDAIKRTVASGIAAFAIIVDAKDKRAAAFYERFGFQQFADHERRLFLPLSDTLKRLMHDE